jgi:hypothetical protein
MFSSELFPGIDVGRLIGGVSVALMDTSDAEPGNKGISATEIHKAARTLITSARYPRLESGAQAKHTSRPVYLALRKNDAIVPVDLTVGYANEAPEGDYKVYKSAAQIDIDVGETFNEETSNYIKRQL